MASPTTCWSWGGQDLRAQPQHERRALLEQALAGTRLGALAADRGGDLGGAGRAARAQPRARRRGPDAQALEAAYGTGRTKADGTVVEVEDRADDASTAC